MYVVLFFGGEGNDGRSSPGTASTAAKTNHNCRNEDVVQLFGGKSKKTSYLFLVWLDSLSMPFHSLPGSLSVVYVLPTYSQSGLCRNGIYIYFFRGGGWWC